MMKRCVLVLFTAIAAFDMEPAAAQEQQGWFRRTLSLERFRNWREVRRERQLAEARRARERRKFTAGAGERSDGPRSEVERSKAAREEAAARPATRVYGFMRGEPNHRRRGECLAPRSVVGLERYSLEEAKENAISLWMEAEKLHNGVKYMDPDYAIVLSADGKSPDCYISSTGNRASEQLAAKVNKVLHQCEFRARPCSAAADVDRQRR